MSNLTPKDTIIINGRQISDCEGSILMDLKSQKVMTVKRSSGLNVYSIPTLFRFDLIIQCTPGTPDDKELMELFLNQEKYK